MAELIRTDVEAYAATHSTPLSGAIADAANWTERNHPQPQMMSGLVEARVLEALIVAGDARHVLEVGTFTGVGTLVMAAALAPDGKVTTLELDPDHAAIARRHIDATPYGERIELIVGDAKETIARLEGPFDLVYIDAWKADYPAYLEAVLPKLAPRGVIAADNVLRNGLALDPDTTDEGTQGVQEYTRRIDADPGLCSALLTIGDGMLLAWRSPGD